MINATLIGQMFTFAIFVWVTLRFVWPPIHQALEARRARIEQHIQRAEAREKSAQDKEKALHAEIQAAKQDLKKQREAGKKEQQALMQEARRVAEEEKAVIVASADELIQQAQSKAEVALRQGVAKHVVLGLEKVLKAQMTAELNEEVVRSLLAEHNDNHASEQDV